MNNFYVYVFLRKDRYSPYYVGKGSGRRCYSKQGRGCGVPRDKSRIVIIKEGLTEEESFSVEKFFILFWGRKDLGTGVLLNKSDGGEGNSGYRHTEETKFKCGLPMRGRKESDDHKKWRGNIISESYKNRPLEECIRQSEYTLDKNTQRRPIVYQGVSYRSLNECSRQLMKEYNLSRNTILRYIKEGRPLSNTKRSIEYYKGTYTGSKYL